MYSIYSFLSGNSRNKRRVVKKKIHITEAQLKFQLIQVVLHISNLPVLYSY